MKSRNRWRILLFGLAVALPAIGAGFAVAYLSIDQFDYQPQQSSQVAAVKTEPPKQLTVEDFPIPELVRLTNIERVNTGAGQLTENALLNKAASDKCNDMVAKNYWEHNSPDGNKPWVFITNVGYSYARAGENLAYGYASASNTVSGWMGSPSHKQNLLNPNFTQVGFGVCIGENYVGDPDKGDKGRHIIVVQHLATPY